MNIAPIITPSLSPLRETLESVNIRPHTPEHIEAHKAYLTAELILPLGRFERFLVRFFHKHRILHEFGVIASVAGIIVFFFLTILGKVPFLTGPLCLGLTFLMTYQVRLERITLVDWVQINLTPWNADEYLPKHVQILFCTIFSRLQETGIHGVRYFMEYPTCEKLEDPLFGLEHEGETHYFAIWT